MTPLTPNALNGGAAGFPEFHYVYIEPAAFKHYKKTGEFPEGTTIVSTHPVRTTDVLS